jgi:hypothetical protein
MSDQIVDANKMDANCPNCQTPDCPAGQELAEARARLEQKINDAADFVEGMIIMERVRAARGFAESVDVMGLLNAIQNEIRRPIVCVEETK